MQRKQETANLELLSIEYPAESLMSSMIYTSKGKWSKKSKNSIIICNTTYSSFEEIRIKFNKPIKKEKSDASYSVLGNIVKFKIEDKVVSHKIGINDNHHDFIMTSLNCSKKFFKHIRTYFTLNKSGNITIDLPEDYEEEFILFGEGPDLMDFNYDNVGTIDWKEDALIKVWLPIDDDITKFDLKINIGDKEVKFNIKMNSGKVAPPAGPAEFPGKEIFTDASSEEDEDFSKITNGDIVRPVIGEWRVYLQLEKTFINAGCHLINADRDSKEKLDLPLEVKATLQNIFNYFKQKDTVPSLCPLDDELIQLYKEYNDAVINIFQSIPTNRSLELEEYNLTKLGCVEKWDKLYLSPFHPINVAYILEYQSQYDDKESSYFARKLLSPYYLIPYLSYNDRKHRPYTNDLLDKLRGWLAYEGITSEQQERTNDITTKMVWTKMEAFLSHFPYFFQDKDSPIILSTIGITDDTNFIKGVIEFIKNQYVNGVQRIEIHEYVQNLMNETFFEKLNRIESIDGLTREFERIDIKFNSKDYTVQDIIHALFTRVSFYKHSLDECNDQIGYSHLAFYIMDTGNILIKQPTHELRTELSFDGLISIPSTLLKNGAYIIGYGTKGQKSPSGYIYPMTDAMNCMYANEANQGSNAFTRNVCEAKWFKFEQSSLLQSIYDNANWVTFINPEVDIDFFYRQNLYIVHYTDQYTINAKYDSITVTKHIGQYENMLKNSYNHFGLDRQHLDTFTTKMLDYFNCLNGNWLLSIINKTESQIKEKMSLVATSIAIRSFMYIFRSIPIHFSGVLKAQN